MPSDWAPYVLPWDDAPVDLSFVFEKEAPAGRHGFLKREGSRFVFEDGTIGRFWGTCFNSAANFPPHEYSEKIARRLAKFGVNMMRPHQLDAEWSTPNIFQFEKGRPLTNTLDLDPRSLDRLDYLVYCLKEQGVYVNLDLLCYRKFKPGDGVEAVDQLGEAAKPYTAFDSRLIELQKKYAYDMLTHINPYTGLAYKDDPAIALVGLVNENDVIGRKITVEPYRSRLEQQYRAWAAERDIPVSGDPVDFSVRSEPIMRFLVEVEQRFYREMISYLRELGVRVPVTGTNMSLGGLPILWALGAADYSDCHTYWRYIEHGIKRSMLANRYVAFERLSFMRRLDMPFFVGEWDEPWPNEWRAESPLIMAAVAALQDWSGLTTHTYRYRHTAPVEHIGGVIMGRYRHRRYFDTFNDPAIFGLFQHAALIFRRADVDTARETVGIQIPEEMVFGSFLNYPTPYSWSAHGDAKPEALEKIPALILASEKHKIGMVLPGATPEADALVAPTEAQVNEHTDQVTSDTGQLHRNLEKRIGWIDTPRTKAAYGFLGDSGEVSLDGLTIRAESPFAVIAISSLTDESVVTSSQLLLTAVGRADNSGAQYNADHTEQLDSGHGPVLIEVIQAAIELETTQPSLNVWAVSPEGLYSGTVPTEYRDGKLRFVIGRPQASHGGDIDPTMYYLIHP